MISEVTIHKVQSIEVSPVRFNEHFASREIVIWVDNKCVTITLYTDADPLDEEAKNLKIKF